MLFFAILVGLAERSVLPMAITRMVHAPHQSAEESPTAESYCSAPDWIVNQTGGIAAPDESVCMNINVS